MMNFPNLDRSTAFMTPPCLSFSRLFLQLSSASFSSSSLFSSTMEESIVRLVSSAGGGASSSDLLVSIRTDVFPVNMMKKLKRQNQEITALTSIRSLRSYIVIQIVSTHPSSWFLAITENSLLSKFLWHF